jgi:predicted nucleic acid-binding protein
MAYLLDTTAFSDLMREHPQMQIRLAALSPDETLSICTVVRGEILHGLGRLPEGQRRDDLIVKATRLFDTIPCLSIAESVADHYAEIKLARQRKGLALDEKMICRSRPQRGNPVPRSSVATATFGASMG